MAVHSSTRNTYACMRMATLTVIFTDRRLGAMYLVTVHLSGCVCSRLGALRILLPSVPSLIKYAAAVHGKAGTGCIYIYSHQFVCRWQAVSHTIIKTGKRQTKEPTKQFSLHFDTLNMPHRSSTLMETQSMLWIYLSTCQACILTPLVCLIGVQHWWRHDQCSGPFRPHAKPAFGGLV